MDFVWDEFPSWRPKGQHWVSYLRDLCRTSAALVTAALFVGVLLVVCKSLFLPVTSAGFVKATFSWRYSCGDHEGYFTHAIASTGIRDTWLTTTILWLTCVATNILRKCFSEVNKLEPCLAKTLYVKKKHVKTLSNLFKLHPYLFG